MRYVSALQISAFSRPESVMSIAKSNLEEKRMGLGLMTAVL